jgi:hypothetical protein
LFAISFLQNNIPSVSQYAMKSTKVAIAGQSSSKSKDNQNPVVQTAVVNVATSDTDTDAGTNKTEEVNDSNSLILLLQHLYLESLTYSSSTFIWSH